MISTISLTPRVPEPLADLRRRRTSRRSEGIDPFDAFYRVYISALTVGIVLVYVASAVGDAAVSAAVVSEVQREGAATLGLLTAVAIAVGLRSGSRGGPLALERPDVQHVLLAPIDRRRALAGPALRQSQFLTFAAGAGGATAGLFAASRLPGGIAAWAAWGAAWAVLSVVAATAVAWLASTARLHHATATALASVIVGAAALDLARATGTLPDLPDQLHYLPTELFGEIGTFPLASHDLVWVPVVVVLVAVGLAGRRLGRVSIERLERRSRLVGELRFAATMRDLRTVMVLRRQLSQERPRSRPWFGPGGGRRRALVTGETATVVRRGRRSLLRTPATRIVRIVGFAGGAAVAAIGVYRGTTALLVVAGLCSFVAALDATEPLAEELDRIPILALSPVTRGRILVRHMIVPALVLVFVALGVVGAMAVAGVSGDGLAVAQAVAVPAALASLAGAAVSIMRNDSLHGPTDDANMVLPEVAGLHLVYQTAFPPAIATLGFVPVLSARTPPPDTLPAAAASGTGLFVLIAVALVAAWVRFRGDIQRWTAEARQQAGLGRPTTVTEPGDDDD